jgi:hypothetical protein
MHFGPFLSALVLFLASPLAWAEERTVPGSTAEMQLSFAPVVREPRPRW